jgi:Ser/Thr protein kinase RdoA (MazF antagonist)
MTAPHLPERLPLTADVARELAASAATGRDAVHHLDLPCGQAVIKLHSRKERWSAETHAYLTWVPAVPERAPRLLGISDDPPALILTAVPGRRLDQIRLQPPAEHEVFAQLGEWLRTFHGCASAHYGTGITSWLAERGRQWLARAASILTAEERYDVANHLTALEQLGDLPAVPCHLDFTPSNVILRPDGAILVIDFEHARYDLASRDLVRLNDRVWPARPDLADAFFRTYGSLTDLDMEVIRHTTGLDRVTRRCRVIERSGSGTRQ